MELFYGQNQSDIDDGDKKVLAARGIRMPYLRKTLGGWYVHEGYGWGLSENLKLKVKTRARALMLLREQRSEYFKWLNSQGQLKRRKMMTRPMMETVANWFDCEPTEESISRRVYKATDCGAWISFRDGAAEVGSIVEGVDFGTGTAELKWPFTLEQLLDAISDVEDEAKEIWEMTHGCDDCPENPDWGGHIIDPNCKSCKGEGVIL